MDSGVRLMRCDRCPTEWHEWCRDVETPSGDTCPACGQDEYGYGYPVRVVSREPFRNESAYLVEGSIRTAHGGEG